MGVDHATYDLARELAHDYLNLDHAMNRAGGLIREGWLKAVPKVSYGVRWGLKDEVEVCDSYEAAVEFQTWVLEGGVKEAPIVSSTSQVVYRETPWEPL